MKFNFASPYFLILIPIIIILFYKIRYNGSLKIPGIEPIKKVRKKSKTYMLGKILILSSIILMVIALARPQISSKNKIIKKNGIDIVVALDLSNSMLQQDFTPNRLEVAKHLLTRFIEKRPDDRISLIVFGGDAYTKVPLTFDHSVVKDITSKLTTDDITSNNRTAIGMGLGIAINRLKNSTAKSKVIILMTDGENNSGEMSPMGAANIAKELGIKIYTIGIGAKELRYGPALIKNNELDENLLKEIAETTHGEYFRASNEKEFENIFNKINQLEKTKIDGKTYYEHIEVFENILKIALVLLIIGAFLEYIKYIRIP
ncbi:VWA domain-containing protein [uncultured Fusobacterium sp.]|uniref:vWA domain-containing protein n=1 Tax=uncultured Fusobacterium sp. TaxID=159267 RepID=UPI002585D1FB|nr:VWA domain-containing protein [uncultured Fusobacterium sp.]